jgi:hypothetical protein
MTVMGVLTVRATSAQVATPVAPQNPAAVPVLRQVHAYDAAWARRDTVMIRMLLAPSYQYTSAATGVASRAQTLAWLALPGYHPDVSTRDSVSVQMHDSTATLESVVHTSGSMNGHTFSEVQRCALDLIASKGVWLIASEQCVKVAPPAPPARRRGRRPM